LVIREEKNRLQARLEAIKEEECEIRKALDENAARAAEAILVEEASIEKLE
jgi:hypothetical protein